MGTTAIDDCATIFRDPGARLLPTPACTATECSATTASSLSASQLRASAARTRVRGDLAAAAAPQARQPMDDMRDTALAGHRLT
jgi:hypothetical protein